MVVGRRGAVVMCLLAVLVPAGCGSVGEVPAGPVGPFPVRPVALDLSGVDLCATLTAEQKAARSIDRERAKVAQVGGKPSPGCLWRSESTGISWTVQIVEASAVTAWVPGESRLVIVDGYGAVREPDAAHNAAGTDPFCQLPVDVNDTQTVRVQVAGSGDQRDGSDPAAVDNVCVLASDFAGEVLDNLRR